MLSVSINKSLVTYILFTVNTAVTKLTLLPS